ncbi:MAG: hypothetical protein K6E11_00185 [Bacilli bacterium]|nr:hypothetical protein [Bacilli bacterium]
MNYEEFSEFEKVIDIANPLVKGFKFKSGETFFVEPAFYTQLVNFEELYTSEDFHRIVKKMKELAFERKRVIFTYDYENPFMLKDDYIYLEFTDVTDSLKIFIEDKSRGSDYGD